MLTIPDEVKALFSADVIHKNFHVHFPNGECADLNNENIVADSVTFTENICSQQYFKFGLAEASQIEFTAVNIPNVRGVYIECAIEIDCTRLGATWAANNPVDNTLPFLTPQTCLIGTTLYYRVPYGRFRVDTCPRNHGALYQRMITAYSETIADEALQNQFEITKGNAYIPFENIYAPNIYLLFAELCNQKSMFERDEWTNTTVSPITPSGGQIPSKIKSAVVFLEDDNTEYTLYVSSSYFNYSRGNDNMENLLLTVDTERDTATEKATIKSFIKTEAGIDWERTLEAASADSVDAFINSLLVNALFNLTLHYSYTSKTASYSDILSLSASNLSDVVYPKIGNAKTKFALSGFYELPRGSYRVYIMPSGGGASVVSEDFNYSSTSTALISHTLSASNPFSDVIMKIGATLKKKKYFDALSKSVKAFTHSNAFSVLEYIEDQLELCGWFLKPTRTGALELFQMSSNPTAIEIEKKDWSDIWWDETPVDAIGKVRLIYTVNGEEQQQSFIIGDGNSVYIMENNSILNEAVFTDGKIEVILDTFFTPNANVIHFTPVEAEMRGLPYLESGDYVQYTAADETEVETYILTQTITGIQNLRATITSTNGELLEVIE